MNIRNKSMISKVFQLDEQSVFRYDQIRTFDSIRLQEKISTLLSQDFKQIQEGITQYMFSST
jgi:mRNA-degrading endonuclease toxin of MazEF toxin-antitoxin module